MGSLAQSRELRKRPHEGSSFCEIEDLFISGGGRRSRSLSRRASANSAKKLPLNRPMKVSSVAMSDVSLIANHASAASLRTSLLGGSADVVGTFGCPVRYTRLPRPLLSQGCCTPPVEANTVSFTFWNRLRWSRPGFPSSSASAAAYGPLHSPRSEAV